MGADLVLGAGLVLKSTAKLGAHFNHGEGVSLHAELPGLRRWVNTGKVRFFFILFSSVHLISVTQVLQSFTWNLYLLCMGICSN